jgi:hypothetical protein
MRTAFPALLHFRLVFPTPSLLSRLSASPFQYSETGISGFCESLIALLRDVVD